MTGAERTTGRRPHGSGLLLFLALLTLTAVGLEAQERGDGWARCAPEGSGTSSIRGRLVGQEDRARTQPGEAPRSGGREGMSLSGDRIGPGCWLTTTADGAFEFRGLPAGSYEIDLAALGYFGASPLEVELAPDTTVHLVIPVHERDLLRSCMNAPRCARILTSRTPPELDGTDHALRILGYRVALIAAGGGWDEPDWIACVDSDQAAARATLEQVFPRLGHAEDCRPPREEFAGHRFTHRPTGQPARILHVGRIQRVGPDTAFASLSYTAGRLRAVMYRCTLERVEEVWVARSCVVTAVA